MSAYHYRKTVNITSEENKVFICRYLGFLGNLDYYLMHEQIDEEEEKNRTFKTKCFLRDFEDTRLIAEAHEDMLNQSLKKLLKRLGRCKTWRECFHCLPSNFHVNHDSFDIIEKDVVFHYTFENELSGMAGILIEKPTYSGVIDATVWKFPFLTNLGEDYPYIYWFNHNETFCLFSDKGRGDLLRFGKLFEFRRALFFDVHNGGVLKPCSYNAQTLKCLVSCKKSNQSVCF